MERAHFPASIWDQPRALARPANSPAFLGIGLEAGIADAGMGGAAGRGAVAAGAVSTLAAVFSAISSMSWVKMSEAAVTFRTAATSARLHAILMIVFHVSARSGLSTRSTFWPSITVAPSGHCAPQPFFFFQHSQPPPYCSLPLMMAACPHSGQIRSPLR